ncbi:MAG: signal recognition particle-docking protein FtsY [Thermodesulfobacteriota bacterium]|nr:signal recognition particle-docking protein FtsY [Thermodesulfobacteriota bacterium]
MALNWFKKKKKTEEEGEEQIPQPLDPDLQLEKSQEAHQAPDSLHGLEGEPQQEDREVSNTIEGTSVPKKEGTETPKRGFFSRLRKERTEEPAPKAREELAREEDAPCEAMQEAEHPPEAIAPEKEKAQAEGEKQGFFRRLSTRLSKTRKGFVSRVDQLLLGKKEIDDELLEELEEILITSDIGVQATMALIERVREKVERKDLSKPEELKQALQDEILALLNVVPGPAPTAHGNPHVIMVVGVNGTGKTTTIAKLSARYVKGGKRVLLIAADTFRAAAVEQLEIWADRVGADLVRHKGKADPSAVVYDGIQAAVSRGVDIVLIDTAGRLHTKVNLMEELKKIRRTVTRQLPDAPHETLLVLDATTGQNAISQAQLFHEAIEITGIALAKLDGTAKGGIVVGICDTLALPLRYIGLGEQVDDLQEFDAQAFVKALFKEAS